MSSSSLGMIKRFHGASVWCGFALYMAIMSERLVQLEHPLGSWQWQLTSYRTVARPYAVQWMHLEGPEIEAGESQSELPSEDGIRGRCGAGKREGAAEATGGGKPGKCRSNCSGGLTHVARVLPLLRHSSNIRVGLASLMRRLMPSRLAYSRRKTLKA